RPVVLKALATRRLPDSNEIARCGQPWKAWYGQALELNRPCTTWRRILLEDEERRYQRTLVCFGMQEVKDTPEYAIAATPCLMEFMSGRLVVTEIYELTCVQIEMVRPVWIFAARVEYDELFVFAISGSSESTLVAASGHNLRNRVTPGVLGLTALIHRI